MLPATKTSRLSLADVLPSSLDAVLGQPNALGLGPVDRAVVLLVDGLGTAPLGVRAGHARSIAPLVTRSSTIRAGFPTTTAASLATLTTGSQPGAHGLVGYTVLDAAHDRVVNQLTGWDDRMDPATWQRMPTVFEQAAARGVPSAVVAAARYRTSGFTQAVLRGAAYHSGSSMADRAEVARDLLDSHERIIIYLYVPELDVAAHAHGFESNEWTERLEELDAMVRELTRSLDPREGLLLTADHGGLDVPERGHVLFDGDPGLVEGIRFIAGEPRCLQLHFEPGLSAQHRAASLARWEASEGSRAFVLSRDEAIGAGLFGPDVAEEVVPRIGDVIVAARRRVAYYDTRSPNQAGRSMIGQHGSLSDEETAIPLLRYGAFSA